MLSKSELLSKYEILTAEMKKRGLKLGENTPLDVALGVALFKRAMLGIDVTRLGDVVVVPDYITIGGGFVKSPRDVEDLDLVMRQDEGERDEGTELEISRLVKKQTGKECRFVYSKSGPHSNYIPAFDLVLRAKDDTRRVKVKGGYGKGTEKAKVAWVIPKVYIPIMGGYAHEHSKNEFSQMVVKWRADVTNEEYLEEFGNLLYKAIKGKLGTAWEVLTYPGEVDSGRPIHHLVKWLAKKIGVVYRSIQTQSAASFGNKRVLIIDDIVASGATARKAVKRVRKGNAKAVGFAALARSKPRLEDRFWLEKEESGGKVEISKPETDEENHRIPVRDCKITATIDISEKDGIKALYCGKEKEIATYLFDVDRFTMKEAKAWVKEHFKPKALNFGFKKIDKEEHIVGGIIYEPDKEDTQGDQANAKEIWKALKNYMIKGKSIKVMHKGKAKSIPIVECFQAEEDTHKGGTGPEHLIKKGAWWLSVYLGGEPEIWKDVLAGKLNGFSMAGRAEAST